MSSFAHLLRGPLRRPALLATALVLAAAADFAIYRLVAPVFEASAYVLIPTSRPTLFPDADATRADRDEEARRVLRSEIALISIPTVIKDALGDPTIGESPTIRASASPLAHVRASLKVKPVPDTDLVAISYESTVPEEAAAVANAIAASYLRTSQDGESQRHRILRSRLEKALHGFREEKRRKVDEPFPGGGAELHAAFNRLRAERLASIQIERAETDDAAKKAELDGGAERLQALPPGDPETGKVLEWKAEFEAIRRDEEHVRRKLENLQFAMDRDAPRPSLVDHASVPTTPIRDLRRVGMGTATASILLAALAVGLPRGGPRAAGPPTTPVA